MIKIAQEPNCLADSLALSLLFADGAISQYAGGAMNLNLLHRAVFTSIHQVEAMPMTRVKCFYACDPPGEQRLLMNGGAAAAAAALQFESNCRICIPKSFICSNEFTCISAQAGELYIYNIIALGTFSKVSAIYDPSLCCLFNGRCACLSTWIFFIFLRSFEDMIYICDTVCDLFLTGAVRAVKTVES